MKQKNTTSKRLPTLLRYPGGKALPKARNPVRSYFPETFGEYREPFCGGAGLFFTVDPAIPRWINDLNRPLIAVYEALKARPRQFIEMCMRIDPTRPGEPLITTKAGTTFPKVLWDEFNRLRDDESADPALRFLFLNCHAMCGRVFLERDRRHRTIFNKSNRWTTGLFERMEQAAAYFADAKITCSDFEELFDVRGDDVLIYADPPYVVETEMPWSGKLYEYGFTMQDHVRLRDAIVRCPHKVVLSYGDDLRIRKLYESIDFFIHEAEWTYSSRKNRIKKGKELIITNFPVVRTAEIIVPREMRQLNTGTEVEERAAA